MRKILFSVLATSAIATCALAQNTTLPKASERYKRNPAILTVTGCLERGNDANTFMLTKVPNPLTDSVAASAGAAAPTITYQLTGGENLGAHVGHTIQVTGRSAMKPQTPVKVADADQKHQQKTGDKTAQTEVKEKAAISVRPLAVQSFKMVSADCK